MPAKSRRRIVLSLFLLPLVLVTAWGIHSFLVRQAAANTRALIAEVLSSDDDAAIDSLNNGADPNAVAQNPSSDLGNVPLPLLIHAIRSGNEKIVKALLDHGANPNVRDSSDTTPLSDAVPWNRTAIVSDLLAHGADVNRRIEGETVLFWATTGSNADAALVRLLLAHGADVNVQEEDFHQTVLMRVANDSPSSSQSAIMQALLSAHPRLELKDMGGDTAWHIASKAGNKEVVALLKKAGAVEYSIFPPIVTRRVAYSITDLGPGQANALNNRGDVAGQAFNGKKDNGKKDFDGHLFGQAFVWRQGRCQFLDPFHGPFSTANSISDQGRVIGEGVKAADFSRNDWTRSVFVWQNGVFRDPDSGPGAWGGRRWPDLHTLDGRIWDHVEPVAMNNKGQIVFCLGASGSEFGGVWNGRKLTVLTSPNNGPVVYEGHTVNSYVNNDAYSINDNGTIVGEDDDREAVIWAHGKPKALLGLYHHGEMDNQVRAEHINNHGQIVGTVSDDLSVRNPEQHAVLWSGGKVGDLNTLIPANAGWVLEDARAINEHGQIVGRGTYRGAEHAFLLTPLAGSKRVY